MYRARHLHVQIGITLIVCLIGLYWLIWQIGVSIRPILVSARFRLATNVSTMDCLDELMLIFGIDTVDFSRPIYTRLNNPVPISQSCQHLFAPTRPPPKNFTKSEKISSSQQVQIYTIVHWLMSNFSRHNLELFLAGGSLLGSVRHFGMFPWDADADVMILSSQKPMVRKILIDMSSSDEYRFVDTERSNQHWQLGIFCTVDQGKPPTKMYGTDRLYPSKSCKTIVDFFFGHVEKTLYKRVDYPYKFPIEHIYPLITRPYGKYLLPVPRIPEKFLSAVYGNDYESKCHLKYFHYKDYQCADLRSIYPFVTHLLLPHGTMSVQVDVLVYQSKMLALFIPKHF